VRSKVALQLLLAHAPFETWSLPVESRETGTGPAVTVDDLEQLRHDLERTDVVELLRATLDAA